MSILFTLEVSLELAIFVAAAATGAGLFEAVRRLTANRLLNFMNRKGGKSFFVISGDQEIVGPAYELTMGIVRQLEADRNAKAAEATEAAKTPEGIKLSEEDTSPTQTNAQ